MTPVIRSQQVVGSFEAKTHLSRLLWEVAIKTNLGKLKIPENVTDFAVSLREKFGFQMLSIKVSHLEKLTVCRAIMMIHSIVC